MKITNYRIRKLIKAHKELISMYEDDNGPTQGCPLCFSVLKSIGDLDCSKCTYVLLYECTCGVFWSQRKQPAHFRSVYKKGKEAREERIKFHQECIVKLRELRRNKTI